ncbi:MAG: hypothetical protein ACPG5T_06595 [Endozoicomonas sp.]
MTVELFSYFWVKRTKLACFNAHARSVVLITDHNVSDIDKEPLYSRAEQKGGVIWQQVQ